MALRDRPSPPTLPFANLRALGIGQIIDYAFRFYRRHFLQLILATGVILVPVSVLFYFVDLEFLGSGTYLLLFVQGFLSYPALAAVSTSLWRSHSGESVGFRSAYGRVREWMLPLFLLALLQVAIWVAAVGVASLGGALATGGGSAVVTFFWILVITAPYFILYLRLQVSVPASTLR